MMSRNVLLNMELEEDDDEDGDIGKCPGPGRGDPGRTPLRGSQSNSVVFLRPLRTVLRGPCSRVHDTPDPVPRRPQAAPLAGPARSPAPARRDKNKRAGAAGAGQGRGATPGGGRWPISTRPPARQTVPSHGLQTLYKVNLGVGCGFSFRSDFTHKSFKSREFDNTPL